MDYRRIIFPVSITAFIVNFIMIASLRWDYISYWFYIDILLAIMPVILFFSFIKLKKNLYLFILWFILFVSSFVSFWFLKKELGIFEFNFTSLVPLIASLIMLYYAIVCFLLGNEIISEKNDVLGFYTRVNKKYKKELFYPSNRLCSIMYFVCFILEVLMIFFLGVAYKYFATIALLVMPFIITYVNEKYLFEKIKKDISSNSNWRLFLFFISFLF